MLERAGLDVQQGMFLLPLLSQAPNTLIFSFNGVTWLQKSRGTGSSTRQLTFGPPLRMHH